jgi:hypothetical protein
VPASCCCAAPPSISHLLLLLPGLLVLLHRCRLSSRLSCTAPAWPLDHSHQLSGLLQQHSHSMPCSQAHMSPHTTNAAPQ